MIKLRMFMNTDPDLFLRLLNFLMEVCHESVRELTPNCNSLLSALIRALA